MDKERNSRSGEAYLIVGEAKIYDCLAPRMEMMSPFSVVEFILMKIIIGQIRII